MSLTAVPAKDQWEPRYIADSISDVLDLSTHKFVPFNKPLECRPAEGRIFIANTSMGESMCLRLASVLRLSGWNYYRIAEPLMAWWQKNIGDMGQDEGLGSLEFHQQWKHDVLSDTIRVFGKSRNYPSSRCLVQFDYVRPICKVCLKATSAPGYDHCGGPECVPF